MHTGPLIGLLDAWTAILTSLNTEHYTNIMRTSNGARVAKISALREAGLVGSSLGRRGGHILMTPLSAIPLSRLLAIQTFPACPTLRFLEHAGNVTLASLIAGRQPGDNKRCGISLGALIGTLVNLSHIHPLHHTEMVYNGICHGYVIRILNLLKHQGLVRMTPEKRVMLTRPFCQMTVGDIAVLLPKGHWVYDTLISRFASVKLSALC